MTTLPPFAWLFQGGPFAWAVAAVTALAMAWAVLSARGRPVHRWIDVVVAFGVLIYLLGLLGGQLGLVQTFNAVSLASPGMKQTLLVEGATFSTYPLRVGGLGGLAALLVLVGVVQYAPAAPDRRGFGWRALGAGALLLLAGATTLAALPFVALLLWNEPVLASEALFRGIAASLLASLAVPLYGAVRGLLTWWHGRRSAG